MICIITNNNNYKNKLLEFLAKRCQFLIRFLLPFTIKHIKYEMKKIDNIDYCICKIPINNTMIKYYSNKLYEYYYNTIYKFNYNNNVTSYIFSDNFNKIRNINKKKHMMCFLDRILIKIIKSNTYKNALIVAKEIDNSFYITASILSDYVKEITLITYNKEKALDYAYKLQENNGASIWVTNRVRKIPDESIIVIINGVEILDSISLNKYAYIINLDNNYIIKKCKVTNSIVIGFRDKELEQICYDNNIDAHMLFDSILKEKNIFIDDWIIKGDNNDLISYIKSNIYLKQLE